MVKYDSKIEREKEEEEQKAKLQDLIDNLDKQHIVRLINQGFKTKVFGSSEWFDKLQFLFSVGEFNYTITREPNNLNLEAVRLQRERNKKLQQVNKANAILQNVLKRDS
jgi:hypothetical protein